MIKISGYSDDLVEFDGDFIDEIGAYNSDVVISFDDGTVIRMTYGSDEDAAWHGIIEKQGAKQVTVKKLIDEDDYYSDELTIDASITGWKIYPIGTDWEVTGDADKRV